MSVTLGEVGPIVSGIVYCAVILECMQLFDLPRAAEWTDALDEWCAAQPDLVPYRGLCLVHRSQLQQAAGEWPRRMSTAAGACERLADPPHPALGLACYQEAELRRLGGEFDAADDEYRQASRPGTSRCPVWRCSSWRAATRGRGGQHPSRAQEVPAVRAAGRCSPRRSRSTLRPATWRRARRQPTSWQRSPAASTFGGARRDGGSAMGAVLGRRGRTRRRHRAAAGRGEAWQSLHMPYEAARTAVLLGHACAALGDRHRQRWSSTTPAGLRRARAPARAASRRRRWPARPR